MSDASESQQYCSRCLTTFPGDPEQCTNLGCRRKRPSAGWGRIFEGGEIFDRTYRIHQMLAVGGAGVTYIARELDADEEETGPKLALKILLAARDQGPYVRRLATEAQIIQELDHPNIVQYLGFVHRSGHSPYLITRFESGGSLLDHMRRVGTLSVKQAAVVGRQICWALEKGHERGIVHRDLKPENVLIARPVPKGEDPVVRVADFGIAKVTGSLGSGITRVGAFVGTPHYAAPEQFVGGAVSEMADVYSVGALLFFCMTARHVIRFADRLDPDDSFQLLCDSLPAVVRRDQDPPDDVDRMNQVLAVAMSVDPLRRCSVVQLDHMLEAILADRDPEIPERPRAEPTDEISVASASVVGVAAALEVASAPAPAAPAPTPSGQTREATEQLGPAGMVQRTEVTASVRSESADAPTAGSPAPAAAPAAPPSGAGGMIAAIAVVLIVGVLAAVGWTLRGSLLSDDPSPKKPPTRSGEMPVELTGGESSSTARADYAAIQKSADNLGDWLADVCSAGKGDKARVEVVVEPSGKVREASAKGGGGTSACVAGKVQKAKFARKGRRPVRVELGWSW
jgi:serine/threonine protein kinase